MRHEEIKGSSADLAELIVDYRKKGKDRISIKGTPEETKYDIFLIGFKSWFFLLFPYFAIVTGAVVFFQTKFRDELIFLAGSSILGMIAFIFGLLHLSPEFDKKWRKFFALRTVKGERNRGTFYDFKSREFVVYDISNVVVEYTATKDVSKQLYKIWIKEESGSSIYENQCSARDIVIRDKDKKEKKWNAHFYFKKIPKSGELFLEWI